MMTIPSVSIYLPINKDEGDDNGYLEYMIYDDHSKCLNIFAINKDEGGDGGYGGDGRRYLPHVITSLL